MLPNKEKQLSNSERVFIFCLYLRNRHAEHSAEWFEDVVSKINARRSDRGISKRLVTRFYSSIKSTGQIVLD